MRISAEAEASYALLVSYRPLLHGNYFCSENLGNGLLCVQQKMGATLLKMAERFAGNSTAAAVARAPVTALAASHRRFHKNAGENVEDRHL